MTLKKEHKQLLDRAIKAIDWDSLLEIHKVFKQGVGEGTLAIPGMKRKPFSDSLTINDLKTELKTLVKYAIESELSEIQYSTWMIFWVSDEWDLDINLDFDFDVEDMDEEEMAEIENDLLDQLNQFREASLEIIYTPQRIFLTTPPIERPQIEQSSETLEELLDKALKNEDYENASKLRDLIKEKRKKDI